MANGIPNVSGISNAATSGNILSTDDPTVSAQSTLPQWGIYDLSGQNKVINPDSIIQVDHKRTWRISDYPQEEGAFQSYNKVLTPWDVKVRMTKGGSVSDRTDFLTTLSNIAESLDLYSVRIPEGLYSSMSISDYSLNRTASNGVSLLTVDVAFIQIRISPSPLLSNTASPSGADQVNDGTVQPGPSTPANLTFT